jgi:transposase-like protein
MTGQKRHPPGNIVRKLRRADELAAERKTGEEIAAEIGVSAATPYNWRRAYVRMDTDAPKEQNARLKPAVRRGRAGQGRAAGGSEGKILSPTADPTPSSHQEHT